MFALHMAQRKPSCDNLRIFLNGFALMKSFANAILRCTTLSKNSVSESYRPQGKLLDQRYFYSNILLSGFWRAISTQRGSRYRSGGSRSTRQEAGNEYQDADVGGSRCGVCNGGRGPGRTATTGHASKAGPAGCSSPHTTVTSCSRSTSCTHSA